MSFKLVEAVTKLGIVECHHVALGAVTFDGHRFQT